MQVRRLYWGPPATPLRLVRSLSHAASSGMADLMKRRALVKTLPMLLGRSSSLWGAQFPVQKLEPRMRHSEGCTKDGKKPLHVTKYCHMRRTDNTNQYSHQRTCGARQCTTNKQSNLLETVTKIHINVLITFANKRGRAWGAHQYT